MAMEWNSRNDRFDPNGGNGRKSFEAHNESMREFRSSHADVAVVNGPRLDEAALLERMRSLQVNRTMMETGGSALPSDITDRSALVPMWKVARYKLSQN
ncbi:hypothetical protein ES703_64383 [subsurface metagenome]